MTGFGDVIVGIDGSQVGRDALNFAADEASRRGAKLVAVHAADAPVEGEPGVHRMEVHEFANILRTEAVAIVAAVHPGLDCETVVREGDAARLLIEMSRTADLVVVGTHRMGRLRGFVLGSVSQRVAAHADCPVVTISGPTGTADGPVVVGASASSGGLAALRFACIEARLRGVPVKAIRAVVVDDWLTPGFGDPIAKSFEALQAAARAEMQVVLNVAAEEFPDAHIEASMPTAGPFVALQDAATTASMLVLGSRPAEESPLPHLGAVAAWLLHQAQCPLAVVNFVEQKQETVPLVADEPAAVPG